MSIYYFYKEDCTACQLLKKAVESMFEKINDNVYKYMIDVEKDNVLVDKYKIFVIPTIILLNDKGEEIKKWRSDNPPFKEIISLANKY